MPILKNEDKLYIQAFREIRRYIIDKELKPGDQLQRDPPHLAISAKKHEDIVDALERNDYRAFARAMLNHFSSGKYTRGD